jgi:hypothetical protein
MERFNDSLSIRISTWADKSKNVVNAVIEITKNTRPKMEVATKEALNPIKQDMKKGKLRDYPLDIFWNYGGPSLLRITEYNSAYLRSDPNIPILACLFHRDPRFPILRPTSRPSSRACAQRGPYNTRRTCDAHAHAPRGAVQA